MKQTQEILKQSIDSIGEVIDKLLDEVEAAQTLGHGPQSTLKVTKLIKVNRDLLKELDFGGSFDRYCENEDRLQKKMRLNDN